MNGLIPRFRFIMTIASMIVMVTTHGQVRRPQITIAINGREVIEQSLGFSLEGERGTRRVIPLKPDIEGTFTVKVEWEGSAKSLALLLNGPGQTGFYARKDGSSPLFLQYKFTRQQLASGGPWQVSIVNFEAGTSAIGSVSLYWPAVTAPPRATPGDTLLMEYKEFLALDRSKWGKSQKQYLPDGTYRIDYPTGFYIIKFPNKGIVFYHAEEKRIYKVYEMMLIINVPTADPPASTVQGSSSAWATKMNEWIQSINASLLLEIKKLLDNDENLLKKFTDLEKGKTIYQKLIFRLKSVDELRELNEGH